MKSDILLTVRNGVPACPYCKRTLKIHIDENTMATGLDLYCDRCHRQLKVDISRGLCRLSPCPD